MKKRSAVRCGSIFTVFPASSVCTACIMALSVLLWGTACTPRVEVAPPNEPITINLNVKIDHEVRVKVEKELDEVLAKDGELF